MKISAANLKKFQEQYLHQQDRDNAARIIQKYMKGYFVTRKKKPKIAKKARTIIDIANRLSYQKGIPDLSRLMR
jgi:hypothetical protein